MNIFVIEERFLSVGFMRDLGTDEGNRKEKTPKEILPKKFYPGSAANNCRTVIIIDGALSVDLTFIGVIEATDNSVGSFFVITATNVVKRYYL